MYSLSIPVYSPKLKYYIRAYILGYGHMKDALRRFDEDSTPYAIKRLPLEDSIDVEFDISGQLAFLTEQSYKSPMLQLVKKF